jgi:RHS repeat-associated protein
VSHSIKDVYVLGHLAYQTDQNGTTLATFTYDSSGVPASVQVGSDPTTAPRYYYVYNGHGDVVALVDATGASVASYAYDAFGQITSASENFGGTTTWTNPYRYDGRDGVRYDGETDLSWMSVRAYDPALGRFLSRDPLGRVPLFFTDQSYVYAGNNPLSNVDPSGQFMVDIAPAQAHAMMKQMARKFRVRPLTGNTPHTSSRRYNASCGEEYCAIGHHQTGGLFSTFGYNTSKIEFVGRQAILDFIAKLQQAKNDMTGLIIQTGALTTGAIVAVLTVIGALLGAPAGPPGAAGGAGLGASGGVVVSLPVNGALYYYYRVMLDVVAKAVRRLEQLAYSLRNNPDSPLVVDVEERQVQFPWWAFAARADSELLRSAGILYGALLVSVPCPSGQRCVSPAPPQD